MVVSAVAFDGAVGRLVGREPTPAQAYDDRNFDADVQSALDALAPEYRAAVVLCDIEGLSYEEIAATLGVKLGTVRSRIHRGRAQLRSALMHRAPRDTTSTDTMFTDTTSTDTPRDLFRGDASTEPTEGM